MFKLTCENFHCEMRKTCLYEGSCERCKIEQCQICIFKNACDYNKEKKKHESKIRNNAKSNGCA